MRVEMVLLGELCDDGIGIAHAIGQSKWMLIVVNGYGRQVVLPGGGGRRGEVKAADVAWCRIVFRFDQYR